MSPFETASLSPAALACLLHLGSSAFTCAATQLWQVVKCEVTGEERHAPPALFFYGD